MLIDKHSSSIYDERMAEFVTFDITYENGDPVVEAAESFDEALEWAAEIAELNATDGRAPVWANAADEIRAAKGRHAFLDGSNVETVELPSVGRSLVITRIISS